MEACIIMHNIIIEDEGDVNVEKRFDDEKENVQVSHYRTRDLEFIKTHKEIRDNEIHH
jgi:hypothetical protein